MAMTRRFILAAAALAALALAGAPLTAHAEVSTVRISHGHGLLYLPLMVMRDQQLLEKHAQKMGLGAVKSTWLILDGGNVINDAMLAGNLDIAGTGAPGFLVLWSKAEGIPRSEVTALGALSTSSMWLNTNNPAIKSLSDFTSEDKIAVPGIKTSLSAVVLQMAAAKTMGTENYARLDPLTISLSHPKAVGALLSGNTEVTAHVASPPFSYQELKSPRIRRIFKSTELLGNITLDVVFARKHFTQTNPRLVQAFMAAQEEANTYISTNRRAAAEIFLRVSKIKMSVAEVEEVLADPDTQFTTTPNGMMEYVAFMRKSRTIKTRPAVWSDLFIPAFKSRQGS
jgi:NitT/TauT family transport system substrate-binding protein